MCPLRYVECPPFFQRHNYSHTSLITQKLLDFCEILGNYYKQHDCHEFKINTIMKNCYLKRADPLIIVYQAHIEIRNRFRVVALSSWAFLFNESMVLLLAR